MTLLEVLAALVILATLLTGLLMAKGRAERQHALAERRLRAIAAADELIADWWAQNAVPSNSAGKFSRHTGLQWQTRTTKAQSEGPAQSPIVRVEIMDVADKAALASVDLWMPDETPAPAPPDGN